MFRIFLYVVLTSTILFTTTQLIAQDHDDMDVSDAEIDPKRLAAAVQKGLEWLKTQQKPDGSWVGVGGTTEGNFPGGCTALTLFALLKCGVDRNDPAIIKGFEYCFDVPNKQVPQDPNNPGGGAQAGNWEHRVYSVSCLILALEARYAPNEKKDAPKEGTSKHDKWVTTPYDEKVRKNFQQNATPLDRKVMEELVKWLLSQQQANVWRYPGPAQDGNPEDASNTQYAMLALNSARRLGFAIPAEVWVKVADYFVKYQEKDGPQVEWFPIPGADFPVSKLKKMADEVMRELRKQLRKNRARSRGRKEDEEDGKKGPSTTVVIEDPYQKFGVEKVDMFARGWSYIPKGLAGAEHAWMEQTCGSMTTSGAAALMICKAGIEGTGAYRTWESKINKGIRDGCAWLARNFTVSENPGRGGYHYYYLYGLERVGVLTLCRMLGKNDWYEEGARHILGAQQPGGFWQGGGESQLVNTCFALLFLKRATTPIVEIPKEAFTGSDLFGGKRKKPEEK